MAVTALTKFSQGLVIGSPGVALKGVAGTLVSIENGSPIDVASWKIDLVYTPPGSGVTPGTLAMGNTNTPFAQFMPGAQPGSYRVQLTVYSDINQSGASNKDIRVFAVPHSSGVVFPPYQNLPPKLPVLNSGILGEKPDEMNFSSQPYGWDGTGSDGLLLDFLRRVTAREFGGAAFSIKVVPPGESQLIPVGSEMLYTGTLDGDYDVEGEVTEISDAPAPASFVVPWVPLWKSGIVGNRFIDGDTVALAFGQVAMCEVAPGDTVTLNLPATTLADVGKVVGALDNDSKNNGILLFNPALGELISTLSLFATTDNTPVKSIIMWADGNGSWHIL